MRMSVPALFIMLLSYVYGGDVTEDGGELPPEFDGELPSDFGGRLPPELGDKLPLESPSDFNGFTLNFGDKFYNGEKTQKLGDNQTVHYPTQANNTHVSSITAPQPTTTTEFPLANFLNLTANNSLLSFMRRYTCSFSKQFHTVYCSCSENCFQLQTCCLDVLWKENQSVSLEEYREKLRKKSKATKPLTCERLIDSKRFTSNRYFMVSTCNNTTNEEDVSQCMKPEKTLFPVIGSDSFLYKNAYCARCNSVAINRTIEIKGQCSVVNGLEVKCEIGPKHEEENILTPCRPRKDCVGCLEIKSGLEFVCDKRFGGLDAFEEIYIKTCHSYQSKQNFVRSILKDNLEVITSSSMLSFDHNGKITKYTHGEMGKSVNLDSVCTDLESLESDNCLQVRCFGRWFVMKGTECVVSTPTWISGKINTLTYDSCLLVQQPSLFLISKSDSIISDDVREQLLLILGIVKSDIKVYHNNYESIVFKIQKEISRSFLKELENKYHYIKKELERNNDELILSASKEPLLSNHHNGLSFENTFSGKRICYKPKTFDNLVRVNISSSCQMNNWKTGEISSDALYWIKIGSSKLLRQITICEKFYFSDKCSAPEIVSNITIKETGVINYLGKTYSVERYLPQNNNTLICVHVPSTEDLNSLFLKIYRLVSLSGAILNTLSYIVFIITFCIFEQLETVPGLCTLTLVVFLLITDSMYLLAVLLSINKYDQVLPLCKTIAVITHFGLVMSQFWCMTIAYDLMSSFTNYSLIPTRKKYNRYCYYYATTMFFTFLIVLAAFLMDNFNIVVTGYGSNGICMPHEFYGRLIFYIIPTLISFTCSLIFIFIAICKVHAENTRNRQTSKDIGRKNMNVSLFTLKVILLVGFSEVVGFIQIVKTNKSESEMVFNQVIALVYSSLRCLRGPLMLIIYVFKRDVMRTYEERISTVRFTSSVRTDEL